MMVIAETVNRRGRLIIDGNMMKVHERRFNPEGDAYWVSVWSSECLDDDDVLDGTEFMEWYVGLGAKYHSR